MQQNPALRRRSRLTFVLLCLMAFIMYIDRTNLAVAAPVLSKELGFNKTSLGMLFSAFAVSYSCFMIPGGWYSDRIGARKAMLIYGLVWSAATIATGMLSGFVALNGAGSGAPVGMRPAGWPTRWRR